VPYIISIYVSLNRSDPHPDACLEAQERKINKQNIGIKISIFTPGLKSPHLGLLSDEENGKCGIVQSSLISATKVRSASEPDVALA